MPAETVATFRTALAASRAAFEMDVFEDSVHGFSFTENGRAFEPVAAHAVWEKILGLLHRSLRP